ncbi:MAG: metal-binding protein ZinT [Jannaschia sp.]
MQAPAQVTKDADAASTHDHAHAHGPEDIRSGYFDDSQIAPRSLADWEGAWQSVYPLLQDGTLDPVMVHKAEKGDRTAVEYHAKYEIGYETDVDRIVIDGDSVMFHEDDGAYGGIYRSDGHEVLTYEAGNRGVRFIFEKVEGDAVAPQFIQFSDHRIAPEAADHYHLYWGDDRAALLEELTNWPTYYPASKDGAEIAAEMMAH